MFMTTKAFSTFDRGPGCLSLAYIVNFLTTIFDRSDQLANHFTIQWDIIKDSCIPVIVHSHSQILDN